MANKFTPDDVKRLREAGEKATHEPITWRFDEQEDSVFSADRQEEDLGIGIGSFDCDGDGPFAALAANAAIPACDLIEDMARVVRAADEFRRASLKAGLHLHQPQPESALLWAALYEITKNHSKWLPEAATGKERDDAK